MIFKCCYNSKKNNLNGVLRKWKNLKQLSNKVLDLKGKQFMNLNSFGESLLIKILRIIFIEERTVK